MKRNSNKRLYWQSLLSALVFSIFAYIAIGSFGGAQQKRDLGNGVFEVSKSFSNGKTETSTGKVDDYGRWHGTITIVQEINYELNKTEVVEMVNGVRHGESKTTWSNGAVVVHCYNMGERVDCEKAAIINAEEKSPFEILSYKYPWFVYKLNAFGFENDYIQAFMDSIVSVMEANNYEVAEFEDAFQDAVDALQETYFDSLIVINEELNLFQGLELLDGDEFRMAVIDRFRAGTDSTFNVIEQTYTNYLHSLNQSEVSNSDFEIFCFKFDSLLTTYGPLDVNDPFLLDSLDNRMYRAIDYIGSNEKSASLLTGSLKSEIISRSKNDFAGLYKMLNPLMKQLNLMSNPSEVAGVVVSFMLLKFSEANLIKRTIFESAKIKNGVISLPVVTTELSTKNSATSVTIKGYVTEDGGAAVTSKGVAWAKIYNPTTSDQIQSGGSGLGSFSATISGLTEGDTYFVRSFATNSAGTVYGNCVRFVASLNTGIEVLETSDLNFSIFPNPAYSEVTFSFQTKSSEKLVLTVYNMNGQIATQKNLDNLPQGETRIKIDVTGFENGIYSCRLTNNEKINVIRKFIISH